MLTITVILIVAVFMIVLGRSYAYFEQNVEGSSLSLEVGSLVHTLKSEVTVPALERKMIKVVVSNVDKIASKYQLVYSSSNDLTDVIVGYSNKSTNLPYGDLLANKENYVTIIVQNNSTTEKTVYVDVRGGLASNTVEDIVLKPGEYRINKMVEESKTIKDIVLAKVDETKVIDFTQISSETNGRGIYKYKEDGQDVYYWRGKVTDNHVIFAGYCWEMVRTTKTGGVKMIYDGTPVEVNGKKTCPNTGDDSQLANTGTFNLNNDDNAYFGYMYGLTGLTSELSTPQCIKLNQTGTYSEVGPEKSEIECTNNRGKWVTTAYQATHANVVNSTIKSAIDEWFSTSNLNKPENIKRIEDAIYCNDRSIDTISGYGNKLGYGKNQTAYNARYRFYSSTDKKPILECTNVNDRFTVNKSNGNGDLTYPVGLLTADEIALAGAIYDNTSNDDYYLNTGRIYWSLSPSGFNSVGAVIIFENHHGNMNGYYVNTTHGLRPVISLVSGTGFADSGDGSETKPFVVQ